MGKGLRKAERGKEVIRKGDTEDIEIGEKLGMRRIGVEESWGKDWKKRWRQRRRIGLGNRQRNGRRNRSGKVWRGWEDEDKEDTPSHGPSCVYHQRTRNTLHMQHQPKLKFFRVQADIHKAESQPSTTFGSSLLYKWLRKNRTTGGP